METQVHVGVHELGLRPSVWVQDADARHDHADGSQAARVPRPAPASDRGLRELRVAHGALRQRAPHPAEARRAGDPRVE